jgi:hypothetical protein
MLTTAFTNSISVDGWTVYDLAPVKDDLGCEWILTKLDGWFAGTDWRSSPVARLSDGSFDGDTTRDSRTITIEGTLVAPDRGTLLRGMDRLSAVLAGSARRGEVVVVEQEQPLTRVVQARLGGPTMINRTSRRTAEFSLVLFCPDPLRYSALEHVETMLPALPGPGRPYDLTFPRSWASLGSTGRLNAHNDGDARTYPTIVLHGPFGWAQINDEASTLRLDMALLDGQDIEIDCGARTVLLGGASRRYFLSVDSRWLVLDGGDNVLHFDTDARTGSATVVWRDAWS